MSSKVPGGGGGLPVPPVNSIFYFGFRMSSKVAESALSRNASTRQIPDFRLPGSKSSGSIVRWTHSGDLYEMFADIIYRGSTPASGGVPGEQAHQYEFKYWYVKVRSVTRQGTLPVLGAEKVTIPSSAFNGGYYTGGSGSSSQPPTLSVFLPQKLTTSYAPKFFCGWDGANTYGPGTEYIKGTPGSSAPDPGPNAPDDSSDSSDKEEPDVPSVRLKNYKTAWNPPLIRYASGAYVPFDREPQSEASEGDPLGGVTSDPSPTRQSLLGVGTYSRRIGRKGWIVQDTTWSRDWSTREDAEIKSEDQSKKTWQKDSLVLEDKKRYGFRFLYNPGEISFGMGQYLNVNPAVLLTSKKSVTPITNPENPPSITINLLLNRTEDLGLISRTRTRNGWSYTLDEGLNPYGKGNWREHIEGIATRGTMWDLEYLFRTCLGRPMPTDLRGTTADLGIFFGVPLIINLSDRMRYRCRMNSISYNHTSFTVDMIPILTSVSLNMTRLPDGASFKPGKAPKDGKK